MIKLLIFILFFYCICTSCTHEPMHVKVGNELIFKFSTKARKLYKLHFVGGVGEGYRNIKEFNCYFNSFQELTVNEVRKLMVENIELLLNSINSDPKLSPYLNEVPFSLNNIRFTIAFHKPPNCFEFFDEPAIALVSLQNGFLHYEYYNKKNYSFLTVLIESYKEAINLVQHQKNLESLPNHVPEYSVEELNGIFKNHSI